MHAVMPRLGHYCTSFPFQLMTITGNSPYKRCTLHDQRVTRLTSSWLTPAYRYTGYRLSLNMWYFLKACETTLNLMCRVTLTNVQWASSCNVITCLQLTFRWVSSLSNSPQTISSTSPCMIYAGSTTPRPEKYHFTLNFHPMYHKFK